MFDDADTFLKIAVGLGVLAAGAGVGYHYGIYLPEIERQKIERAEQAERDRQTTERKKIEQAEQAERVRQQSALVRERERRARYLACYADVLTYHSADWDAACKLVERGKGCSLEISTAERLNERLASEKLRCLEETKSGV